MSSASLSSHKDSRLTGSNAVRISMKRYDVLLGLAAVPFIPTVGHNSYGTRPFYYILASLKRALISAQNELATAYSIATSGRTQGNHKPLSHQPSGVVHWVAVVEKK